MRTDSASRQVLAVFSLVFLLILSCNLPSRLAGLGLTPTPTASATRHSTTSPTLSPNATLTPASPIPLTETPTPTATQPPTTTPTPTTTRTLTPTRTFTLTRTRTPIPPSLTPGPNQITSGQDVWTLRSVQRTYHLIIKETDVVPARYRRWYSGRVFLLLNFECTTGRSLISLYAGNDQGLTFVHKVTGYPDLYLVDSVNRQYPIHFIGDCWLATPIYPESSGFKLFFQHLAPLVIQENP